MKKLAIVTVAALALGLGIPTNALAAAPKAGASCAKAGITQTVSGKKFTCVKSGKKLVWNKGVVVSKPKPTPVAPVITLDSLNSDWTLKVALAKVQEKLLSLPETSLKPEMIFSPTTREDEKQLEQKLLVPAMKLFQGYFAPTNYKVVMFTNQDGDWANQALITHGGGFPFKLSDEIAKWSGGQNLCNFAFATKGIGGAPIYYECTDTRSIRNWYNYQNPPHEYFHLVQQKLAPVRIPAWLHEGSAAFFGEALGYQSTSTPVENKRQQNLNTSNNFDPDNAGFSPTRFKSWTKSADAKEVTRIYKFLEAADISNAVGSRHAYYSMGSIATEVLVAVYGVDGFMKIWTELAAGKSFEAAFLGAFGLTPTDFYVKLTPYINKLF